MPKNGIVSVNFWSKIDKYIHFQFSHKILIRYAIIAKIDWLGLGKLQRATVWLKDIAADGNRAWDRRAESAQEELRERSEAEAERLAARYSSE